MRKVFLLMAAILMLVAVSAWASDDVKIGSSSTGAKIVHMVKPVYPPEAKAVKVQGAVVVKIQIEKDGTVRVLSASGPEQLQAAASEAVSQWRYQPVLVEGKAVTAEADVKVNFELAKDKKQP